MAIINFHNVQHGEYITIDMQTSDGNPLFVIRDMGTYPQTLTPFLKCEAKKLIACSKVKDAILSHSHRDHSNGFFFIHESLSKDRRINNVRPFRNAYIPYLRYNDAKDLGALMLKVGLCYLCLLPTLSSKSSIISNWIKTTPVMYDLSDRLIGVEQGFHFLDWGQEGKVLWPPRSDSDYYKELVAFLDETADVLVDKIPQNKSTSVLTAYDNIRSVLMQLNGNGQESRILNAYEVVKSHLEAFLRQCHVDSSTHPVEKHLDRERRNKYLDCIDNHSIVFSLDSVDGSNGILFLSDLCNSPMDILCKDWEPCTYKFIKSAHHGNRLGNQLAQKVKADTIIHCCGDSNANFHGPDCSYLNLGSTNLCSDWSYNNKWENRNSFKLFDDDKYTITI